jgi:predicted metal-binding protein
LKCGIIRCQQTEDFCPGTTDFAVAKDRKGAFEEFDNVEIVGFVSCGGCPGKRAVARAKILIERGAEAIVLASCIGKGNPFQFPCPHFAAMRQAIEKAIAGRARIIDWTH